MSDSNLSKQERVENLVTTMHRNQTAIRDLQIAIDRERRVHASNEEQLARLIIPPDLAHHEKITVLIGNLFFEVWYEECRAYPIEEQPRDFSKAPLPLTTCVTYKPRVRTRP